MGGPGPGRLGRPNRWAGEPRPGGLAATLWWGSLGSHEVLVLECGALEVDDPLGPQGYLQDPPDLDVHLGRAQDDHVIVLPGVGGGVEPAPARIRDPQTHPVAWGLPRGGGLWGGASPAAGGGHRTHSGSP